MMNKTGHSQSVQLYLDDWDVSFHNFTTQRHNAYMWIIATKLYAFCTKLLKGREQITHKTNLNKFIFMSTLKIFRHLFWEKTMSQNVIKKKYNYRPLSVRIYNQRRLSFIIWQSQTIVIQNLQTQTTPLFLQFVYHLKALDMKIQFEMIQSKMLGDKK